MLPLIQDKAWQPAPSNVRATEASKQYDYTTHMAKIKAAEHSEKINRKKEFMDATWNAILINSHLQKLLIISLELPSKIEKWTMRNRDEYTSLVQHANLFSFCIQEKKN